MALIPWVDAAYAPTVAEIAAAVADGYKAVGFYLPNIPNSDPMNVWTVAQVQACQAGGLMVVPIVVPDPTLDGDPTTLASAAYSEAVLFGLSPTMSCLYTGNHLETSGQITGPIWVPAPGPAPTTIGVGSAVQWGTGTIAGWSVDLDLAAGDFGFSDLIVVDFEYDTTPDVGWYQTFQTQIAVLAAPKPTPSPAGKEPAMMIITVAASGIAALSNGVARKHITSPADLAAYQKAGIPLVEVSQAEYDSYQESAVAQS